MSEPNLDSESIKVLLKSVHPSIQQYIAKLKVINAKLQKRIVEQEAEEVSLRNRIAALEKQRDEFKAALDKPSTSLQLVLNTPSDHKPGS